MNTMTVTGRTPINVDMDMQAVENQPDSEVQNVAQSRFEGIKKFFSNHGKKIFLVVAYIGVFAGLLPVMGPVAFGIGLLATALIAAMAFS